MKRRMRSTRGGLRLAAAAGLLLLTQAIGGCSSLQDGPGYYLQSMFGHLDVISRAKPVDTVIADDSTDPALRKRLEQARAMRVFASRSLGLPDNASYTTYADLQRPYVLWNVFATPELSLNLQQWCFPVAGCVSYRGYYDRADADRFAKALDQQRLDVSVGGVPAYSTLGWFDDPLLSTFVQYPEGELARLIFHELAHQVVYVPGDTTFNESFASAVEEIGVEKWFAQRNDPAAALAFRQYDERRRQFRELLIRHKTSLAAVYSQPVSDEVKRLGKQKVFESLRADYQQLKDSWGGNPAYDRWFSQPVNNARLAAVGAYSDLVPAFRVMFDQSNGDFTQFYAKVQQLAALDKPLRDARLAALAQSRQLAQSD
jgi:predicted aminopeptidase